MNHGPVRDNAWLQLVANKINADAEMMVIDQAAGTAAAMAGDSKVDEVNVRDVPINHLQHVLIEQKALLR
jgi:sugar (pentulose or hexulose) kinase